MEFALKTAFINTFPTQAAGPATCVPPSTCPCAECALGHGQGSPLVWARCPRETLQSWPRARGTGRGLFHHHPPWLSSHLETHWADAPGTCSLPAPSRRPTLHTKPDTHVGASPATPHVPRPNPSTYSALPQTGVAQPFPGLPQASGSPDVQEGTALALPLPAPRDTGRPRAAKEDSIYLRSLRAAAAGGHRRSGSSGHSASRRAPQEWGPPAGQTHGIK